MTERDPHRWSRFAASVAALAALAIALPIGLVAASRSRFGSANPLAGADPPWRWGSGAVGDALSGPIADDTVIDGIIRVSLCFLWVAVVVIVITTVVEVVHAVRHHGLAFPDVRGVGWAQQVARFIAVGLIAVVPMTTSGTSLASTLGARSVATSTFIDAFAPGSTATISPAQTRSATAPATAPATGTVHVVEQGESVYAIAVDLAAGDSLRVIEIADAIIEANLGAVMPGGQRFTNPAYVEAGWTLQIPGDIAPQPSGARTNADDHAPIDDGEAAAMYVVVPGDTLWDIADEQLGDPTAWPEIWERNEGDDMGGGRTFDDPDLILSGWELELADAAPVATSRSQPAVVDPAPETETATATENGTETVVPAPVPDANGPLPITPAPPESIATTTTPTSAPMTPLSTSTSASTSTSVGPPAGAPGADAGDPSSNLPAPDAPSPIRLEHAALVAAGILALVGVRRRQRLRAAMPRHRVPEPRAAVTQTERRLRTIDAGERVLRVDVACRAAARSLIDTGSQIGWVAVSADGDLDVRLTAPATLPSPWTGDGQSWRLGAEVPIEMLGEDARQVGQPCVAL